MTIAVRDLDSLDPALVQAALDEGAARVAELLPDADLRVGVLHNLLLYPHAVLGAGLQANVLDYLNARSLLAIQADPALADPELVDHVLSNFRVARKPGVAARGEVAVVKDNDLTTTYAVGAEFVADGQTFVTERVYTAKAEAALVATAGDRLITPRADGTFVFTVPVVAVTPGAAGRVAKDTIVVPAAVPPGFVAAYAAGDFTAGADAETNDAMLLRLQQGVACKAPASRTSMAAMLREVPAFERVGASSIVGYGDPEMLRDRHWIFPVHGGGRADWYVRTDERLTRAVLTKTATLVAKDGVVGTWQFALTRDDAPGFYEVARVRPAGATGFAGGLRVAADVRGIDLSGDGFRPDVQTAAEGAYSRYQTAVIRVEDTVTDASGLALGARQDYDFDVVGLPLVGAIQDYVNGRDVRAYGADVLVKAPVPCFLQVSLTVVKRAADPDPDADAIRAAVAAVANGAPFAGRLYAGQVHAAVRGLLGDGMSTTGIDLFGRVRYPDGRTAYVRSDDVLAVPDAPADMVSPKTVQFFLAPEAVGVTITAAVPAAL